MLSVLPFSKQRFDINKKEIQKDIVLKSSCQTISNISPNKAVKNNSKIIVQKRRYLYQPLLPLSNHIVIDKNMFG